MPLGRPSILSVVGLAILVASLALKLWTLGPLPSEQHQWRERAALANFLAAQGFRVAPAEVVENRFVRATSGECVMLVGVLSPRGWHNKGFEALAAPGVQLFYVLGGQVYARFPRNRALFDYLRDRLGSILTDRGSATSLLGVAAGVHCGARALPWRQEQARL